MSGGMGCLLIVITGGFFIPVFFLIRIFAAIFSSWRCPRCGGGVSGRKWFHQPQRPELNQGAQVVIQYHESTRISQPYPHQSIGIDHEHAQRHIVGPSIKWAAGKVGAGARWSWPNIKNAANFAWGGLIRVANEARAIWSAISPRKQREYKLSLALAWGIVMVVIAITLHAMHRR